MSKSFVPRGPQGHKLAAKRAEILDFLLPTGISNIRVFGSVARGEDDENSDIDLLADLPPGIGLFGLARAEATLAELLGVSVELVPERALKPRLEKRILAEAVPL